MRSKRIGLGKKDIVMLVSVAALVTGFLAFVVFNLYQKPATGPVAATAVPSQWNGAGPANLPDAALPMPQLEKRNAAHSRGADAWVELGNRYYDSNNVPQAIEAYEKALAIRPGDADVLTDLGVMYRKNGNPLAALKSFDLAIASDSRLEVSRFNKGVVMIFDLKDVEGGVQAWEELVAMHPNAKAPNGRLVSAMIEEIRTKSAAK